MNLVFKWIYLAFLALQVSYLTIGVHPQSIDPCRSSSSLSVIGPKANEQLTPLLFGWLYLANGTSSLILCRVYAFLAVYLLICSFWLTIKAFAVSTQPFCFAHHSITFLQAIPSELQSKTTVQVILTFFTPPVGALIAAMVSTFGKLSL